MVLSRFLAAALLAIVLSCRGPDATSVRPVPALQLRDSAGGTMMFPGDLAHARFTVVVFYAEHCPCFQMHESRLRELASAYADRGVRFVIVDSEIRATSERDGHEAAARNLPPILLDPGARLADALEAEYATYSVVFDASGNVRYRGGIDDDKNVAHADAHFWLRDALDDLLAGKALRRTEGKALGCALQKQ